MEVTSPPFQQNDTRGDCDEKPEEAPDRETTQHEPEPGLDEDEDADLFDWSLDLLPAMKKKTPSKPPSVLFRLIGLFDEDDDELASSEMFQQLSNPFKTPLLNSIQRIATQPEMTADDKQQLRNYKQNHLKRHQNSIAVNDGISLFKLLIADDQAAALEEKYYVDYATESISYDEVIAITYAWHESAKKKEYEVAGKRGGPTFQLGEEWDVNAVLDTLAELSKTYWIWMDQFSSLRSVTTATLSRTIPLIYRNVRVVAFLPYIPCERLFSRIESWRREDYGCENPAEVLADVLLHDSACECTDGLYGWLSRLWTWQEFMLASSLRFVWGLGESKWTKNEFLSERKQTDEKRRPGEGCSGVWTRAKLQGERIKNSVKRSITDLSVFEQPIMKLLNELTKRNTESVIIDKKDTATLSMGYYFCMRLLCGAEVYMPSASQTSPINCLKVLQQIASSGRKGGRLYDCYYAAAAFIDDATFLPEKKALVDQQEEQAERANALRELELRQAYIRLYEREYARLRLPASEVLDDPELLLREYATLYKRQETKKNFRDPGCFETNLEGLQQEYIELYHDVNNTTLVEYTGAPLAGTNDLEPIVWITHEHLVSSELQVGPLTNSMEKKLAERMRVAALVKKNSRGGFLNALVLAGMNEEAFCEVKAQRGDLFYGAAYNIKSVKRINVGRKRDFWANSIRKITKTLHPSQLNRVRSYKAMLTDMKMGLSPLAHAIIHAACFKADPFPAHLAKTCLALLGKRDTKSYVRAMTTLLGGSFAFSDGDEDYTFELAKITFLDGTHCVGIISARTNLRVMNGTRSPIGRFVARLLLPSLDSIVKSTVKVVKTHRRLLLCSYGAYWTIAGYIPGFDADTNETALGWISHTNVAIPRVPIGDVNDQE
ncbi:hypothetical protein DVH05_016610 [Phytophthora capsici]|nr:hypothetical protein DVH05_016610 [Phytophthora capsici]